MCLASPLSVKRRLIFKITSLRSSSEKYDDDDDTFIKVSKL